jgi:hypothetical protein
MAAVRTPGSSARSRNRLLAALSPADFTLLQAHLQPMALPLKRDIERPNRRIDWVCFMESGVTSVVAVRADETEAEVGLIGCEGMTGTAVVLGGDQSPHSTYVQIPGEAQRIAADELRNAIVIWNQQPATSYESRGQEFESLRARQLPCC